MKLQSGLCNAFISLGFVYIRSEVNNLWPIQSIVYQNKQVIHILLHCLISFIFLLLFYVRVSLLFIKLWANYKFITSNCIAATVKNKLFYDSTVFLPHLRGLLHLPEMVNQYYWQKLLKIECNFLFSLQTVFVVVVVVAVKVVEYSKHISDRVIDFLFCYLCWVVDKEFMRVFALVGCRSLAKLLSLSTLLMS